MAESWRERGRALRNRLVADPRFQSFAARFPLTRPIARQKAQKLFDLCAGFVYAQILSAVVRLDVATHLSAGPQSAAELAPTIGLSEEAALTLLRGAAAIGLLQEQERRFALADLGAALHGNPGIAAMVRHHALLYADLADPVALLRGTGGPTQLSQFWAYARRAPEGATDADVAAYSELMAVSNRFVAEDVLGAYPFSRHRRMIDIGGGEGAFAIAAAKAAPGLAITVFDLPPVAARAASCVAEAGLSGRIGTIGGDARRDAPPEKFDLATLVRVAHDHDDATVAALLQTARGALGRGGTLLIAEPMREARGAREVGDAYFAFYLLAMGSGRPRSPAELITLAKAAGFADAKVIATPRPLLVSLIAAKRAD